MNDGDRLREAVPGNRRGPGGHGTGTGCGGRHGLATWRMLVRWTRWSLLVVGSLAGGVPSGRTAPPVLEHLYPAGMNPGTTQVVTASGKFDPWPVEAWVEGGGVRFVARTNAGKFEVVVDAEAPPGPRWVRLFGGDGASEPRLFVVGDGTDVAEVEPNDRFGAAQVVERLPSVVNGRLDRNGDVDSFGVTVKAGEWLDARLDAFTLMSKVDAVLRLVRTNGAALAWNHDHATFDPRIIRQSSVDETVVVQVYGFRYPADASVSLAGGEGAVYRLHLGVTRERPSEMPPGAVEVEPRDRSEPYPALPSDGVVVGVLGTGSEVDRYRVHALGDEVLVVDVEAARWGSPLDPWVRLEEPDGKEIVFNDDGENTRDAHLEWKATREGTVVVAVGSRTHRGGNAHRYRLVVRRGAPEVSGRVASGQVVLEPGRTNELKVTVRRHLGSTQAVSVVVRDLPPGVEAPAVEGPAGAGDVTLRLWSAETTNAYNGPVRVVLRDRATGRESPIPYDLISRGENNGVPQGWSALLREHTEALWLTVKPKP